MNYSKLSKAQKRCIDAFVRVRPELANAESITRPEIEELFFKLYDARETGGEKIGYPMWLVKGEKVSRGVYKFPAPALADSKETSTSSVKATASKSAAIQNTKEEEEFFKDLQEYGVTEKA
jgi:hypothetical protein